MNRVRRPSPQTVAVLRALADRGDDWAYGYDLCVRLDLKAGTIYPILARLAARELLETTWEADAPPGRPPRHLYRLTAAGSQLLTTLAAAESRVVFRPSLGSAGA